MKLQRCIGELGLRRRTSVKIENLTLRVACLSPYLLPLGPLDPSYKGADEGRSAKGAARHSRSSSPQTQPLTGRVCECMNAHSNKTDTSTRGFGAIRQNFSHIGNHRRLTCIA